MAAEPIGSLSFRRCIDSTHSDSRSRSSLAHGVDAQGGAVVGLLAAPPVVIGVEAKDIRADDSHLSGVPRSVSAAPTAVVVVGIGVQAGTFVRRVAPLPQGLLRGKRTYGRLGRKSATAEKERRGGDQDAGSKDDGTLV
jgi:hypothetical protein